MNMVQRLSSSVSTKDVVLNVCLRQVRARLRAACTPFIEMLATRVLCTTRQAQETRYRRLNRGFFCHHKYVTYIQLWTRGQWTSRHW
jgi:hypothetical protein